MREEGLVADGRVESGATHVGHHANNGQEWRIARAVTIPESLADRIIVRPEALRHRLVDDDDLRRIAVVRGSERAAAAQRNTHHLEVVRRRGVEWNLDVLLLGRHLTTVDAEYRGVRRGAEEDVGDERRTLDARHLPHAHEQSVLE